MLQLTDILVELMHGIQQCQPVAQSYKVHQRRLVNRQSENDDSVAGTLRL